LRNVPQKTNLTEDTRSKKTSKKMEATKTFTDSGELVE